MGLATVLSLAGSDPSGGAGIQADSKSIHALGGYALSVATALTAQNSQGVQAVFEVSWKAFAMQLHVLDEDYDFDAIKIGMLADAEKIEIICDFLNGHRQTPVVLDPVLLSSSGSTLLDNDGVELLIKRLIPQITLLTPNLPEAEFLLAQLGIETDLNGLLRQQDVNAIAAALKALNCTNILLKGGHSADDMAVDYLFTGLQTELQIHSFAQPRLAVQHSHGTGCTLSSAIATKLAQGYNLVEAVQQGKDYLHQALLHSDTGQPNYLPVNEKSHRSGGLSHFWHFVECRKS